MELGTVIVVLVVAFIIRMIWDGEKILKHSKK